MKKFVLIIIVFASLTSSLIVKASKVDILMVGDSWASMMCISNAVSSVLGEYKYNKKNFYNHVSLKGCLKTTQFGTRANHWLKDKYFETISDEILSNPKIKIVILSLGGNDFLQFWTNRLTANEEHELFINIQNDMNKLISKILSLRPGIRIILSGYDFPNFADYSFNLEVYDKAFKRMGYPTPEEINRGFSKIIKYYPALKNERVTFVHHLGLMHYYYGNSKYGLAKKKQ